uniref:Uncharacterized protein n=1 Tax=Arundo donax TaxID=35708 RepID=A0A0A9GPX8_ARUDO
MIPKRRLSQVKHGTRKGKKSYISNKQRENNT